MPDFDPNLFIWISDTIFKDSKYNSEECTFRVIAGRIYYGLFLILREKLKQQPYAFNFKGNSSDHGIIKQRLRAMGGDYVAIADSLDSLRRYRNNADYHLDVPFDNSGIKIIFAEKENVILKAKSLRII